jgi:hypothetical protein
VACYDQETFMCLIQTGRSMVRYAAVLSGQPHILEHIAPCFSGDEAWITKLDDIWALVSSAFEGCGKAQDVFPIADSILHRINCILALYTRLLPSLAVTYIQAFDDAGRPLNRGIRGTVSINVYSAEGIAELSGIHGLQSLGSAIVHKANSDPAINEAISLRGDQELGWPQIYDIIEFLGGADEIARNGSATKKRIRDIRQTANHFRHLGSAKKCPLPAILPTIAEARTFVNDLLRRWMTTRL